MPNQDREIDEQEEREIDHLVSQYGKDPMRFVDTIGESKPMSLGDILLKHRTAAIAIHEGKSNGKDIGTAVDEAKQAIQQLIDKAVKDYHNEITDNEKKVWLYKSDFDARIDKAVREAVLNELYLVRETNDGHRFIDRRIAELQGKGESDTVIK